MDVKNYEFRILTIDDNIEIHRDFAKILSKKNSTSEFDALENKLFGGEKTADVMLPQFQIDIATQGKEGVEKIAEAIKQGNPYALAFVDIRMPPGWDGVETIKHIWELDKNIQIVICTAFSDYTWEETTKELGESDNLLILKKPFDTVAVRQLACALTRKWRLMQDVHAYTQSLEETVQVRTEELQHQATHDALTKLPNRVLLYDRMEKAMADADRNKSKFFILFFDLDRFKLINDSLSHSAGDELLCAVSERVGSKIRESDTLSRLGGDEFILVGKNLTNGEELCNFASTILNTISEPIMIANHKLSVTSSIGIAVYPDDGKSTDELIRNADIAMYRSKGLGGNQFQFYTKEMTEESLTYLELETELRQAIVLNQLTLSYQAQNDTKTNTFSSVEALVRWNHPTKGLLLPLAFIPLAEKTGLIVPIGEWVLREACRQNKAWQDAGLPPIRVAVNITSQQLRQLNFIDTLKSILNETGLEPKYLELELTENSIINHTATIEVINALQETGIHITVDDFGTGYSSLSYLRNLNLDRLKIDRSFVQNIQTSHGDEVIIQAIIAMAQGLNLEILAEGVETQNQLNFLTSNKCNDIQGYYFSKPLPPLELAALLREKSLAKKETVKEE